MNRELWFHLDGLKAQNDQKEATQRAELQKLERQQEAEKREKKEQVTPIFMNEGVNAFLLCVCARVYVVVFFLETFFSSIFIFFVQTLES